MASTNKGEFVKLPAPTKVSDKLQYAILKFVSEAEKSERRASTERIIELVMRMSISGPGALDLIPAATELVIPLMVQDSIKTRDFDGGAYDFADIPMRQS